MTNLTIAIHEDVLRDARIEALHRKTSVNRMVVEYLSEVAGRRRRQKDAVHAVRSLVREQGASIDPALYTRTSLYERDPLTNE